MWEKDSEMSVAFFFFCAKEKLSKEADNNKKILERDCKRHTARAVAYSWGVPLFCPEGYPYLVLAEEGVQLTCPGRGGGTPILFWLGGRGYLIVYSDYRFYLAQ